MEGVRERLGRERSDSAGDSVKEHLKRKREMLGRDSLEGERGLADIFKRSKKVLRSPGGKQGREDLRGMLKELKEMKEEMKEGLKGVRREIREEAEGQKKAMKREIDGMKEELRKREEDWKRESEEMEERIEKLERGLEGLKVDIRRNGEERAGGMRMVEEGGRGQEEGKWRERVIRLEMGNERRERGERKRNVLMKGMKEEREGMRVEVERILEKLGGIEEIRKIEAGRKDKGRMVVVRLRNEEEKRRIMGMKWKLRGEDIWIEDDLTWKRREEQDGN